MESNEFLKAVVTETVHRLMCDDEIAHFCDRVIEECSPYGAVSGLRRVYRPTPSRGRC